MGLSSLPVGFLAWDDLALEDTGSLVGLMVDSMRAHAKEYFPEIINIRAEINTIETKKTITKINKTKSWFFEKTNKIDKPLTRLIKKKRERTQINEIRNEKGEVTMETAEIQIIIRDNYKQFYAKDNLEEMDKFLERYNLPRLNQEEIENMNRPNTSAEIETVTKTLPTNQDEMASWVNSIKHLEKS